MRRSYRSRVERFFYAVFPFSTARQLDFTMVSSYFFFYFVRQIRDDYEKGVFGRVITFDAVN